MSDSESNQPRFRLQTLVFVVAIVGLGIGLYLQNTRINELEKNQLPRADERINVTVKDAPLNRVLAQLADASGYNIVAGDDRTAELLVTLDLKKVLWETALDTLATKYKLYIHRGKLEQTRTIRVELPARVEYMFEDADLRVIIQTIANVGGANIIIGPGVPEDQQVTLALSGVPWRTALEALLKNYDLALVEEQFGLLRVIRADPGAKQPSSTDDSKAPQPEKAREKVPEEEPAFSR
jgi:type II secretory pathway component HofQ